MDNSAGQQSHVTKAIRNERPEVMLKRVMRVAELLAAGQTQPTGIAEPQAGSSNELVTIPSYSSPEIAQ